MNGFYYDCRLENDNIGQEIIKKKNINANFMANRLSSKVKNSSSSLALTSCSKREDDSTQMGLMKRNKVVMESKKDENSK